MNSMAKGGKNMEAGGKQTVFFPTKKLDKTEIYS
jgi:hypothetical protein